MTEADTRLSRLRRFGMYASSAGIIVGQLRLAAFDYVEVYVCKFSATTLAERSLFSLPWCIILAAQIALRTTREDWIYRTLNALTLIIACVYSVYAILYSWDMAPIGCDRHDELHYMIIDEFIFYPIVSVIAALVIFYIVFLGLRAAWKLWRRKVTAEEKTVIDRSGR